MVIDDNEFIRRGTKRVLGREHEVQTAGCGEEGLRLAHSGDFDVVVCDLEMPGIDGLEVRRRLPVQMRGRFVLWTGCLEGIEEEICVVRKPATVHDLMAAVREVAGNRRVKAERVE